MTITLNLPAALEDRLRHSAEKADQETFRNLLTEAVEPVVKERLEQTEPPNLTLGEFKELSQKLFESFAAVNRREAPLPDAALTREGIYGDHD